MLMIRLSRIGRKKHPHYRLVIAEKARDTYGRTLEILGHYHPLQEGDKDKLVLHKERILHWISEGAQSSNTVNNLLINAGVIKGDKKRTIGAYKSKSSEGGSASGGKAEDNPPTPKATEGQGKKAQPKAEKEKPAEPEAKEEETKPEDKKEEAPAKK